VTLTLRSYSAGSRRRMRPITRRLLSVLLALAVVAAFAGCGGGGGGGEDVEVLLNRAFHQPVSSADLKVDAQLEVKGLERSVRLEASGVYISSAESLPKLDIDLKVASQEGGQSVESGFLSTGDRAFLKFGGEFYEQPREDIERANRELGRAKADGGPGPLADLGVDPRRWVIEPKREGGGEVAGVPAEHVSARLDARRVFADLNKLVERAQNAIGGVAPGTPQPLTDRQLDQLNEVVKDPAFDVYVGTDDDVIRRISATLEVAVPEAERQRFNGLEGATLRVAIELSDVNGNQTVAAPADSRPIKDLSRQLGGFGALGGEGVGSGAPTSPDGDRNPNTPPATTPGRAPDALQLYSDCLDQASPDDPAALERCNALLPSHP